ncbi:MAG: Saccharopine dehydrogenase [Paenibacillus sp.]|jgi:saccharopine dehydrogenase-like NADP-dependent oxidoreductase|nr:Saccharopine dehydrogenase [Paenibacillus sp.]
MKDKIVVVGGYGQVGQVVCNTLGNIFPGKVHAAGRNYEKAKQFAATTHGKVLPLQMDAHDYRSDKLLEETALVVMCLDQENTRFVEKCLDHNIHYIDVSASHSFLSKVRSLGNYNRPLQSTSVLSVGLAPGLTNLLVKQCANVLDEVHSADIYIMLGLGDQHGKAAIEWMVDNINANYSVLEKGLRINVRSFEDGKKTRFPGTLGRRTAYRFNFADQHVLPDSLGIQTISTRICFDSAATTNLLALLKKLGVYRFLQYSSFRQMVIKLFEKLHWGSDVFVAKVSAEGLINNRTVRYECSIQGQKEYYISGKIAAFVAKNIYKKEHQYGIFHMEELFQPMELIGELGEWVTFDENTVTVTIK